MTSHTLPAGSVWTMDSATFIAQTEEKSRMLQTKTFDIPTLPVIMNSPNYCNEFWTT